MRERERERGGSQGWIRIPTICIAKLSGIPIC
jgi:hypothetical protein